MNDSRVQLVLNLTNPRSHYEVTRASLEAGKHVYSEKPLAMQLDEAEALVELCRVQGSASFFRSLQPAGRNGADSLEGSS